MSGRIMPVMERFAGETEEAANTTKEKSKTEARVAPAFAATEDELRKWRRNMLLKSGITRAGGLVGGGMPASLGSHMDIRGMATAADLAERNTRAFGDSVSETHQVLDKTNQVIERTETIQRKNFFETPMKPVAGAGGAGGVGVASTAETIKVQGEVNVHFDSKLFRTEVATLVAEVIRTPEIMKSLSNAGFLNVQT